MRLYETRQSGRKKLSPATIAETDNPGITYTNVGINGAKVHDYFEEVCPLFEKEMEYYKPVKTDGKPAAFLKVKPKTHESECNGCGKCREICPMNCFVNDLVVPEGTCIKCMACVADCPNKAKYFTDEDLAGHRMMLEGNFADIYRKIETFM